MCVYVNNRYCSSVTIREQICAPDVELLSVYIHPKANAASASRTIHDVIQKLQTMSPEAPNFILGDFNHVSLEKTLTNFYQYVSCPTRRGKTLDLCYGSIKDAFKSLPLPPLSSADHNCVHLLPTYKTVLKREKVQTKTVKIWTNDAVCSLQGFFDCTDWGMFEESCKDLDKLTDVVCSYTAFCRDMLIPSKSVKIYPNNKPWVNKSVKSYIKKKRQAFQQGGSSDLQTATKELKVEILKAKQSYKTTLENKMASNNLSSAWSSMKMITGLQNTRSSSTSVTLNGFSSDTDCANAFNGFYNRFNRSDFSKEIQTLSIELCDNQHFSVT